MDPPTNRGKCHGPQRKPEPKEGGLRGGFGRNQEHVRGPNKQICTLIIIPVPIRIISDPNCGWSMATSMGMIPATNWLRNFGEYQQQDVDHTCLDQDLAVHAHFLGCSAKKQPDQEQIQGQTDQQADQRVQPVCPDHEGHLLAEFMG